MEQHSDRVLSLMLLGDLETAGLAGSKRRHSVPAPSGRRVRSLARHGTTLATFSAIVFGF
ncbi:hypothetical protein CCE29_04485 [Lacticaseibacillus rhamnosus]|uniref:Uncharacterized protein n=1 Tax=Lacticaseibacillus rhamnosus TaxID=47715 RepID=A0AAX0K4U2_LACRH|nr:hypothetical protein B4583_00350 [Lacticaseibacillus rhamnosus]ART95273.1 hypothetical protein CCE29_04485 [Lacticaseibacillus rhamnosus]ONN75628.1 hypothetical protein BWR10_02450 [Lacticaseibacillus rhamnosus]